MAEDIAAASTGEVSSRSPRFTLWIAFLVCSAITLGSAVEEKNNNDNKTGVAVNESAQKWAVACASITLAITTIVVIMMMLPVASIFIVNTRLEGVILLILIVFWAATVAIVSDSDNGLAVKSTGEVANGNLYYFSWAGFVCSIMLFVSYLRGAFNVDVAGELKSRSARLQTWAALLACALIVMGSSSSIFQNDCKGDNVVQSDVYCNRTKYGIALGAVGTVACLMIVGLKICTGIAPFLVESMFGFILAVMNGFGVAFLTSTKGPGAALGNLYYFSWLSFITSMIVTASCVEDYKTGDAAAAGEPEIEQAESNGGMQVESLDDTI